MAEPASSSFFQRARTGWRRDPDQATADERAIAARDAARSSMSQRPAGTPSPPRLVTGLAHAAAPAGSGPASVAESKVAGFSVTEPLTKAEEALLKDGEASILTTEKDSPVFLEVPQRRTIVVFDNGVLVVTPNDRHKTITSEVLNRAKTGGKPVLQVKIADLDTIQSLYDSKSTRRLSSSDLSRVQKILYDIISAAADVNASDLHLKNEGDKAVLARTIRGDFIPLTEMTAIEAKALMMAAFSASLTGDKHWNPQQFRFKRLDTSPDFKVPEKVQALRLQFSPTDNNGMELVARLLYRDTTTEIKDIDTLGYEKPQIERLNIMRRQPYGIILISGPTGSGKSTTLKTALEKTWEDRGGKAKIVTIEDPPEYKIRGATQMPIESGATLDEKKAAFTRAMSAMLRMAPHIGMVGEIRDSNGATLTFEMAKTGHLVWASVHANTALDVVTRVQDLGVKNVDLNDTMMMKGLIAQRLVKAVCSHCALSFNDIAQGRLRDIDATKNVIPDYLIEWYGKAEVGSWTRNMKIARHGGCEKCRDASGSSTGHSGRRVVAETIIPTRSVLTNMLEGRTDAARAEWFTDDKAVSMLEHGLVRVLRGEVDSRDLTYAGDVTQEIEVERIARLAARFHIAT